MTPSPLSPPQVDRTGTAITVRAVTDVPAAALWEVLADPLRHPELDGSGMVRASAGAAPLTAVGQVFTMAMHFESLGDYRTDNHVLALAPGRLLRWTTANEGQPPAGVWWTWELAAGGFDGTDGTDGDGRTTVTHTYDWSHVTDPEVLKNISFPLVSESELEDTLGNLAEAVSG